MGVVRYKSTSELAADRRTELKFESDNEDEEDDEVARTKPLLADGVYMAAAKQIDYRQLHQQLQQQRRRQKRRNQTEQAPAKRSAEDKVDGYATDGQRDSCAPEIELTGWRSCVGGDEREHYHSGQSWPAPDGGQRSARAHRPAVNYGECCEANIVAAARTASLSLSSPALADHWRLGRPDGQWSGQRSGARETKTTVLDADGGAGRPRGGQEPAVCERTCRSAGCARCYADNKDVDSGSQTGLLACRPTDSSGFSLGFGSGSSDGYNVNDSDNGHDNDNALGADQFHGQQLVSERDKAAELAGCKRECPASRAQTVPSAARTRRPAEGQSKFGAAPTKPEEPPALLAPPATDTQSSLMLDLNAAASRLVDNWRHSALHPTHSGSYKVVQQPPVPAAGWPAREVGRNRQPAARRPARLAQPGRSPSSLQRHTNNRLTRHRLKIQQQRQEQLAHLALRERQQLLANSNHTNHTNSASQLQQAQASHAIYHIRSGLVQPAVDGRQRRIHQLPRAPPPPPQPQPQPQPREASQRVIIPIESPHSTAIEICDSQPACSSGGGQPDAIRRSLGAASAGSDGLRPDVNVIVYRSFNMLAHRSQLPAEGARKADAGRLAEDAQTVCSTSSAGSTLSLNRPFCKICHMGAGKSGDKLISPCKCSGTMQYIHCGCLLKWLEISNRSNEKPMSCELCAHEYTWHKKFNYKRLRMPKCSLTDLFLHLIFVASIGVMFFSALAPMLQRRLGDAAALAPSSAGQQTNAARYSLPVEPAEGRVFRHSGSPFGPQVSQAPANGGRLAHDEKFMLLCAASFFVSFFLAIYAQTKARDTLYGLIVKVLEMNQTYYITEYDHGQQQAQVESQNGNSSSRTSSITTANDDNNARASTAITNDAHPVQLQHHQQQYHTYNHPHQQQDNQLYNQQSGGEILRAERKVSQKS